MTLLPAEQLSLSPQPSVLCGACAIVLSHVFAGMCLVTLNPLPLLNTTTSNTLVVDFSSAFRLQMNANSFPVLHAGV